MKTVMVSGAHGQLVTDIIKILGAGEIKNKIDFYQVLATEAAIKKIQNLGCKITLIKNK